MSEEHVSTRLAYLSAAVDASEDALIGLDPDGRVVTWNSSARRLLGGAELQAGALLEATLTDLGGPPQLASAP